MTPNMPAFITRRALLGTAGAAILAIVIAGPAAAAPKTVTIAWQTVVEPSKIPQADGAYEAALGAEIDWRKFDAGAEVIAAVASGAVDIGYVGSSTLAAAASRKLPIETIFIVGLIGSSEALVAREGSGITSVADLKGKRVAVPFVSTTHYSLLAALQHEGVDPAGLQILNLRPPEIGDIDAAYVWDPALGQIRQTGTVVVDSATVAGWGAPTFDAWIVRSDFAKANPEAVTAFVKVTGDAYAAYAADGAGWTPASVAVAKIAGLTGARTEDVPGLLKGYVFPSLADQAGPDLLGGGTATALAQTSAFLKAQEKIDEVLPDYAPYVSARWVTDAAK